MSQDNPPMTMSYDPGLASSTVTRSIRARIESGCGFSPEVDNGLTIPYMETRVLALSLATLGDSAVFSPDSVPSTLDANWAAMMRRGLDEPA